MLSASGGVVSCHSSPGVDVVLRAGADGDLHELVLRRVVLLQRDEALALERPARGAGRAEDAVVLLEDLADLGHGAVAVVGHRLDEEERATGARALVDDLLVGRALELARAALDGALDRVAGHRLALGVADGLAEAWVAAGITAAHAGGDGDLLDKLREELPALGVEGALLVLDGGPLGMAAHWGGRTLVDRRGPGKCRRRSSGPYRVRPRQGICESAGIATRVLARKPSSAA